MRRYVGIVVVVMLSIPRSSRPETDATVRSEIENRVRSFVEATNRGDVNTLMEMYSTRPEVASLGYGGMARGWDAIRADNAQLVGKEGSFRVSLGLIYVVPLGTSHALAFTGGTISAVAETPNEVRLATVPVAFSFVFERTRQAWKIVHQHASAKQ